MKLIPALLDLVLPRACAACRVPSTSLCPGCAAAFADLPVHRTDSGVWAARDAHGVGRALVRAHKDSTVGQLAPPLGAALARSVLAAIADDLDDEVQPFALVPVPQRRAAARRRRRDPTAEIAESAARELRGQGWQVAVVRAATLARQPVDQRGLGIHQRAANLDEAMIVRARAAQGLVGCGIVAVDDVVTTGSTLVELCRALTTAGLDPVGLAAVVATPLIMTSG